MKRLLIIPLLLFLFSAQAQLTDIYVSYSTGSNTNPGTQAAPWKTVKTVTGGHRYLLKRGDVFPVAIPKGTSTSSSAKVVIDAYGTGANPQINGYCTILPTSWEPAGTNIWKVKITDVTKVTGYVPSVSNVGLLKVNGVKYGVRRGDVTGLVAQWQFYCDYVDYLYVYSVGSPNTIASDIEATNDIKLCNLANWTTVQNIDFIGTSQPCFLILQPSNDTIRHCWIRDIGGEMKSATDTTRQGDGIVFYNGGTNSVMEYDSAEYIYEEAYSFQTFAGAGTPLPYTNCLIRYNYSNHNESDCGFHIGSGTSPYPGFFGCRAEYNTFDSAGTSWSHPPNGKPQDNQAVCFLSFGWNTNDNDLIVQYNTINNPKEGLYFITGNDTVIHFTSRYNTIRIDPTVYLRKTDPRFGLKWKWQLKDYQTFITKTTQEISSGWTDLTSDVLSNYDIANTGFSMINGFGELFFDVTDKISYGVDRVKISITYLDQGYGTWNVYCVRCNKTAMGPSVTNQNTGTTKTVSYTVSRFKLNGQLNGLADFSIKTSENFMISSITVTNIDKPVP